MYRTPLFLAIIAISLFASCKKCVECEVYEYCAFCANDSTLQYNSFCGTQQEMETFKTQCFETGGNILSEHSYVDDSRKICTSDRKVIRNFKDSYQNQNYTCTEK